MRKSLRLSDLVGKQVRDERGTSFGYVHEVRTKDSEVTALICGTRGWLQRLASYRTGTRIAWERVKKVADGIITIAEIA
jgi:sporulation protein YlmC with PRC-barrel domain